LYFQFNIYSSLLLPCFIQGILYFILLLYRSKKQDNLADFFLAFLTLWSVSHISGWMLGFAGWYDSRDGYSQFMFYYIFSHWFLLGPLLYFFVKAKTKSNFKLEKKDFKHFILPGLYILWGLICFGIDIVWKQGILGETLPYHSGTKGDFGQRPLGVLDFPIEVLSYASLFFYIFKSNQHYKKYRDYIVSELSIAEEVDFRWVRNILFAFGTVVFIWLIFDIYSLIYSTSYQTEWWSYFFWGLTIFYITISGYKDESHINNQLDFEIDSFDEKEAQEIQKDETAFIQKTALKKVMEDHKLYLKPNLSLHDFAKELNLPPGQLSKILNSSFNQNFNEFVNEFRINEVINKLNRDEFNHYSILGIALESGFNSKATFNRVFKTQTGMSPSQYKNAKASSLKN
jgi:AraC-like DNA-binding protein